MVIEPPNKESRNSSTMLPGSNLNRSTSSGAHSTMTSEGVCCPGHGALPTIPPGDGSRRDRNSSTMPPGANSNRSSSSGARGFAARATALSRQFTCSTVPFTCKAASYVLLVMMLSVTTHKCVAKMPHFCPRFAGDSLISYRKKITEEPIP